MNTYHSERNAKLIYLLNGLGMAGGMLHIAAHPDDEDVGLLAYMSCKYNVWTAYWSGTRGEGGQNRIGPYRDEALGVYRTWESIDAGEIDGAQRFFGPFYDYGYTKNKEEAINKWGHDNLVRELVRIIRLFQPLIIVSRWKGIPGDFHGQHQAFGYAMYEAFEAAGDHRKYQELEAQGLCPWQPQKFYQSMDNSGADLTSGGAANIKGFRNPRYEKPGIVSINTGEFDPVSGLTYQSRAWLAYNKHQTQSMGFVPNPGDFFYYFNLYKSLVDVPTEESDFYEGLDPTLTGLSHYPGHESKKLLDRLAEIKGETNRAHDEFRADEPLKASDGVLKGLNLLRSLRKDLTSLVRYKTSRSALDYYLGRKEKDFEMAAAKCLGLELECKSSRHRIMPGESFEVSAKLWNNRRCDFGKTEFSLSMDETWDSEVVKKQEKKTDNGLPSLTFEEEFSITISETSDLSCPYWLVNQRGPYLYSWPEGEPCSRAVGPPPVAVNCSVDIDGTIVNMRSPVVCKKAFPGGFKEQELQVVPPITLQPQKSWVLRNLNAEERHLDLQVVVKNNSSHNVDGTLELHAPEGWHISPEFYDVILKEPGETETIRFLVNIPDDVEAGMYTLKYNIRCGNRDYTDVVTPVRMNAPGVPPTYEETTAVREAMIIKPADVDVHIIDVKFIQGLRYAYIQGASEEMIDSLDPFGVEFKIISDEEMGFIDLSEFEAVVLGPNAYLIRDELRKYSQRFLNYVKDGGTLIVQFQGYGYQDGPYTPHFFKYNQPHDRVTQENMPVHILSPEHVLFHKPNRITLSDFDHWVRERGLYFFGEWDKRYETLISCSDPGEPPKEGGLVACQYGKGNFLYTGYSFFRQLPAGVPGAFRIFANILALPEARILERVDFLKKISLFALLNEFQLDAIARLMTERWEEEGSYVCRQGDVGKEMYVIYRGAVEVIMEDGEKEKIIYVAREGECIGEMAILADIPRTASLRAQGDLQLLEISGSHFVRLLKENPDMSIQVIKLLVERLSKSSS